MKKNKTTEILQNSIDKRRFYIFYRFLLLSHIYCQLIVKLGHNILMF